MANIRVSILKVAELLEGFLFGFVRAAFALEVDCFSSGIKLTNVYLSQRQLKIKL